MPITIKGHLSLSNILVKVLQMSGYDCSSAYTK